MNQRLSLEEVQEIARLAAQRRSVIHGRGPTVIGVSDALGVPPAEVESLLAEIRDRKAGLNPPDDAKTLRRLAIGAAALALIGILAVVVNLWPGSGSKEPMAAIGGPPPTSFGRPVEQRFDPTASAAPRAVPNVAAMPGTPIDSGLSNGVMPLGREDVKDYSTDLHNARSRAGALLDQPARQKPFALSVR